MLIARPDQYVALLGDLEDISACEAYCEAFMLPYAKIGNVKDIRSGNLGDMKEIDGAKAKDLSTLPL